MSNKCPTRLAPSAAVLAILTCTLYASPAHATGFLTDQFGADHGQPALANAYSIYFNPAAMGGMRGSELTLDGVFAARTMSFNRATSALSPSCNASSPTCTAASDPGYRTVNTGSASLLNVLAAPFLGFVSDLGGSNFRLGVAGYIPFGGQVSWDKIPGYANYPAAPGAYDGPQRWSAISTTTASLYGTVALAYRLEPQRLSFGVSVSAIRTGVTDTRAHNLDGSDDTVSNGNVVEGHSYLDVSGIQVGAALGVHWEPTAQLRLGASYTSQPNFGTMRLSGTFQEYTPGTTISPTNVDLVQAYPDVIRAGAAWRLAPDAELRLDAAWQRWSEFTNQCVVPSGQSCNLTSNGGVPSGVSGKNAVIQNLPRNFQDAVKVRFGGAYWVVPQTELFGSFGLESSPVSTKYDDALIFDSTRIEGTLGVRHGFSSHIFAKVAYSYIYLVPLTVTDSALSTYAQPSKSPSENGSYSSSQYIVDAALSYVF